MCCRSLPNSHPKPKLPFIALFMDACVAHSPPLLVGFDNVISTHELTAQPHDEDGDDALLHVSSIILIPVPYFG